MDKEIIKKISEILVTKIGLSDNEITEDANFIKDLGIDSLDFAELVMEFEQAFDIRIPDSDAEQLSTIGEAADYIKSKIDSK